MSRPEDEKLVLEITISGLRRLSDLVVIEMEESKDEESVPEESGTQIESVETRLPDGTQIYDHTQIYDEETDDNDS